MRESMSIRARSSRPRDGLHSGGHWARLGGLGSSGCGNTSMDLLNHAAAGSLGSEMRGTRMLSWSHWVILDHAWMVRHADLGSRKRLRHHHFRLTKSPSRPNRKE